jgi:hypothetical protein
VTFFTFPYFFSPAIFTSEVGKMTVDIETLMTFADVSALSQVKVGTLRKYVLQDSMPYTKLNGLVRFKPLEIQQWIEERSHRPGKPVVKKAAGSIGKVSVEGDLFEGAL